MLYFKEIEKDTVSCRPGNRRDREASGTELSVLGIEEKLERPRLLAIYSGFEMELGFWSDVKAGVG